MTALGKEGDVTGNEAGEKENNKFPHHSPLASMNEEKLKVRSKEGLFCLEKVKLPSYGRQ